MSTSRITSDDVAREAGVSQTTVSYVLSGSKHAERISHKTKRRVLEAADRLGYSINSVAAALKRGYSDHVVLLTVTWDMPTAISGVAVSISRAASRRGLSMIMEVATHDEEAELTLDNIISLDPYGLLLVWDSVDLPAEKLTRLRTRGVPIIDLLPLDLAGIPSITADRSQGARQCTKHLIGLGHKRIGMILEVSGVWETTRRKLVGYRETLDAAGIGFDKTLIVESSESGLEAGINGFTELIKRRPDATAVLCTSDLAAIGAAFSAQDSGLTIPDDISVAGYGAYSESEYFRPRLTTARAPLEMIAENAVETLVQMRGNPNYRPEPIYAPTQLIIRESTGPARHYPKISQ